MAGRGTDIILGGSSSFKIKRLMKILNFTEKVKFQHTNLKLFLLKQLIKNIKKNQTNFSFKELEILLDLNKIKNINTKYLKKLLNILFFYIKINYKIKSNYQRKKVQELGGLLVIGTERHESRRIDNQLRGRAGRQGDPGTSRFFISLEDKIFRLFGGNNIKNLINTFQLNNDNIPLESNLLTKSLDLAQEKVENYYYEMRKNVYDYDEVLNQQRKVFYSTRSLVLNTSTIRNWILDLGEYVILEIVTYFNEVNLDKKNENLEKKARKSLFLMLERTFKIVKQVPFNVKSN